MTIAQAIRDGIEARIRSGELKPGHRLPVEHELVTAYGCSRATVSKAMASLAAAGLIERRRKAGSFVAPPHLEQAVLAVPDIARIVGERGEVYGWRLAERRAAKATDLADDDPHPGARLFVAGTHLAGGAPFAIERRLIALDAVPGVEEADFEREAPGSWLLARIPWSEARHRIDAVAASRADAKALGVASGAPCLRIERWTWRGASPVTHVVQVFPGDRYSLVARFGPSD